METLSRYYFITEGETAYDEQFDDYRYFRKVCLCEPLPIERDSEKSYEKSENAGDGKK